MPIDGVLGFLGLRFIDHERVKLPIRPDLLNPSGLLSGPVVFAMVDYSMGSALWQQTTEQELIATTNIAINYLQTATSGTAYCRSVLDRRNRTSASLRSEVTHEDGTLMATAIGSYRIFLPKVPAAT